MDSSSVEHQSMSEVSQPILEYRKEVLYPVLGKERRKKYKAQWAREYRRVSQQCSVRNRAMRAEWQRIKPIDYDKNPALYAYKTSENDHSKHLERLKVDHEYKVFWWHECQRTAKQRYEDKPEVKRHKGARNRAKFANAPGSHTASQELRMLGLQNAHCYYCFGVYESDYHLEHKTPLARGGGNGIENLCYSCERCNLIKGTMTAEEFIAKQGLGTNPAREAVDGWITQLFGQSMEAYAQCSG